MLASLRSVIDNTLATCRSSHHRAVLIETVFRLDSCNERTRMFFTFHQANQVRCCQKVKKYFEIMKGDIYITAAF